MKKLRKKVLILNEYYLPGFKAGGPIRSIESIVESLSDTFEFYILTTDRDLGDKQPYSDVRLNHWNRIGESHVFYLDADNLNVSSVKNIIEETPHDVLYLNSFFNLYFSIFPLLFHKIFWASNQKIIVAPRGEFSEGALRIKSFKKQVFIKLSKIIGLHKSVVWQASSEFEKTDILKVYSNAKGRIRVAPNLSSNITHKPAKSINDGVFRIAFLSRISEKKNLDFALSILEGCSGSIQFNIYGNIEDTTYWERCEKIIGGLRSNIDVKYHGAIKHESVGRMIQENNLFFLPTKGENYGHAIVESLLAGVPVLISNTTPWRNLEDNGVGWDIPLNNSKRFRQVIEQYRDRVLVGECISSASIQGWINKKLKNPDIIYANFRLFNDI